MYNLRSKSVKGEYSPKQYQFSSGDKPDKELRVNLSRMPILETPSSIGSEFNVENGKAILKKHNNDSGCKCSHIFSHCRHSFLTIVFIVILFLPAMYYKDEGKTLVRHVAKNLEPLRKLGTNMYAYSGKTLITNLNFLFGRNSHNSGLKKKNPKKRKSKVCYNDIRDFINESWFKVKPLGTINKERAESFIEEQCRIYIVAPKTADYAQYSFTDTYANVDINSLVDYASYDRGARILSTSGTESNVEFKIQSGILQYLFGVKYISIDELPICKFSSTLCRYFVTGPSSLLKPWNKPGECWSFKGTHGRVQIELSERIYITAISLEHVPEGFASSGNILSAPAQFTIIGLDDSESYKKFTSRSHLGTYRYMLNQPNIQTFTLSKEDSSYPYKKIEFNVESNHGNENYTCIYRLRVHGRPMNAMQN